MPIEIKCPNCAAAFRAPDKFAGKRVKCPKCQGTIAAPAAPTASGQPSTAPGATAPPAKKQPAAPKKPTPGKPATIVAPPPSPAAPSSDQSSSDQWYVQTDDGEQYGPVSKGELHEWIAEGRLDASCQVLCEGWEQWKWAEEVFDELATAAEPTADANPFAGIGDVAAQPTIGAAPSVSTPSVSTPGMQTTGVRTMPGRRSDLEMISKIFRISAWVVGGIGLYGAVRFAITFFSNLPPSEMPGFWTFIEWFFYMELSMVGSAFLAGVFLLAASELIKLAMRVEDNTQVTAEASRKAAESG